MSRGRGVSRKNTSVQVNPRTHDGSLGLSIPTPLPSCADRDDDSGGGGGGGELLKFGSVSDKCFQVLKGRLYMEFITVSSSFLCE